MASENPNTSGEPEQQPETAEADSSQGPSREQPSEGSAAASAETPHHSDEVDPKLGSEPPTDDKSRSRRGRFENMLPNLIRRGIEKSIEAGLNTFEKSVETGRETTGAVREVLNEVKVPRDVANAVGKALSEAKLPREIASAVFGQIDETKNDVLRILAREFRDFLQATDISTEIKKALTSLSFEVRTEVRFIPNDAGDGIKADVRARTRVKRSPSPSPRDRSHRRAKAARATPVDEEQDDEELSD